MSKANVLHLADLHLDSPFNSVSYLPDSLKDRLKNASMQAFEVAIDYAIANHCDAVLIAGDIYDGVRTSSRAQVFFKKCIDRLCSAGIYSVIAHGNHDLSTDWALVTEWPENVVFLPVEGFDGIKLVSKEGEPINIVGSSGVYRDLKSLESAIKSISVSLNIDRSHFSFSVFHSDISGTAPESANYNSFLPSDLATLPINYWALGHLHSFNVHRENPHIIYPGTIQGRSLKPSECGEKGGVHVVVENGRIKDLKFVNFSQVIFNHIELKIERVMSPGDLVLEIKNLLAAHLREGVMQILRINLKTLAQNRDSFKTTNKEEEFLFTLRELVFKELGIAIESLRWIQSKDKDSPLVKDILCQVESLIESEFNSSADKINSILKSESLLIGIDTDIDIVEVLDAARERVRSLLQVPNE